MNLKLRDEDRRAVDLLLDRAVTGQGVRPPAAGNGDGNGNGHGNGNGYHGSTFTTVSGDVHARLPAVQKVLHMLDLLPADEPPRDLVARTLDRVGEAAASHPSALRAPQSSVGTGGMQQPHA